MTLSDALVLLAPSDATLPAAEQARRDAAILVVYEALQALAPRFIRDDDPCDLASDVLLTLIRRGPRLEHVATAQGFLVTCLKNRQRDRWRAAARMRTVSIHADDEGLGGHEPVDTETPESFLIETDGQARAGALLVDARQVLYTRAIPEIARTVQNPEGFLASIEDLRAIAQDGLTVDDIVRREGGTEASFVRVRNRVYQRHKRTRAYLLEVPRNRPSNLPRLTEWLRTAGLEPDLDAAVRDVANHDFAPRVVHGSKPVAEGEDS